MLTELTRCGRHTDQSIHLHSASCVRSEYFKMLDAFVPSPTGRQRDAEAGYYARWGRCLDLDTGCYGRDRVRV